MKKFVLTLGVFIISAAYALQQHMGGGATPTLSQAVPVPVTTTTTVTTQQPIASTGTTNSSAATAQTPTQQNQSSQPTQPTSQSAPALTTTTAPAAPVTPPTPAPKPKGQYVDGTYTGTAADAYYGYVQVQATITGGRLTDVAFLQYPNTHNTSVYINSQAMPYLKQEAIQAQSANVSGVSGASATSAGFVQSLASALAQAKA